MRLILKYAEKTKAGSWQYRRRVPKAVSAVITQREFKQKLGDSEREALIAWPRCHAKVEREIAAAKKRIELGASVDQGLATPREAYEEARRRVAELRALGTTTGELEFAADALAATYAQDPETDDPLGATLVDEFTINLMRRGEAKYVSPEPTS